MLDLTPETEALARNLAQEWRLSVDATVREALEARKSIVPVASKKDMSAAAIEARRTRIRQIVAEVAALPILDHRPVSEIIDDLNAP